MSPLVLSFIILELMIVVGGTLFGLKRGLGKTVVRIVYLLIVGLLALLLSFLIDSIGSEAIMDIARGFYPEDLKKLVAASPDFEKTIESFVGAVVFPICYALLFGLFELLSLIGFGKISKKILTAIFPNKEMTPISRGTGAAAGFVISLIVAAVLMSPLYMALSIYSEVPENVFTYNNTKTEVAQVEVSSTLSVTRPHANFKMPKFLFVSRFMTSALTSFETPHGQKTNVLKEIPIIMEFFESALDTVDMTDKKGGDTTDVITNACALLPLYVDESPFLEEIASDALCGMGTILGKGDSVFGITVSTNDPSMAPVVDSFMKCVSETTPQTVKNNMVTLFGKPHAELLPETRQEEAALLGTATKDDYHNTGMVAAFIHMNSEEEHPEDTAAKKNDSLAQAFINMADNEAMGEVFEEVATYTSNLISEKSGDLADENKKEVYETAATRIEDTIAATANSSTEEKVAVVKDILDQAIEEFDVEMEDWEASVLATCAVKEFMEGDYIDENGIPNVSVEDVMSFFGVSEDEIPDWAK